MTDKTILVVGGAGYIGFHQVKMLGGNQITFWKIY